MGTSIATTLELPLLWAALETPESYKYALIPSKVRQTILCAYPNAGGTKAVNPVQCEDFYVTGDGAQLNLVHISNSEPIKANDASAQRSRVGRAVGGEYNRRELAALHSRITANRRYMTEMTHEVQRLRNEQ
ncbi:hypothetical protein PPTG_07938 [Phytophthora nicotianae INRA-310]|uniref:Uncharacterized protein n=1 Tax=Phytophthora nicotianae (strain INRA-310) TaxID=761204 RepID=W2QMB0_PHYN3|nr:hypothetical protein PPTG_07883 [Phytophthora nicotianae INRA-310]XP_008900561.1 hypothetical protein PPTG_07938 [Phytophthora nicotianae INRA-310]ETN14249.1 hypothetical protein PPTG_07883 [Phytophthora nicotianae INRA-310]ETN14312.1 hypothetical protein PPTG_07938 [Phytophthora nicotianae INRA-310]